MAEDDPRQSLASVDTTHRASSPAVKFTMSPSFKSPKNTTIMTLNQSTSTPLLTPANSRGHGSMVLLSPSRTIMETFNALATTTSQQLEETWDEVGYTSEERANQLTDLISKFRDVCEQKIAEERDVAETFRQTILSSKDEIRTKSKSLQIEVNSKLLEPQVDLTLSDEMVQLEAVLEGIREEATAAKTELEGLRDYIIEAHEVLGTKVEEAWRDVDSDLSMPRIEAFSQEKEKLKSEVNTRTSAIIHLVRDCQYLLVKLRIDPELDPVNRQIMGSLVRAKDGKFIMTSKFANPTCIGISSKALDDLTEKVTALHGEKRRRQEKLEELGAEITFLWQQLHVSEEEQLAFTKAADADGLSATTIEIGEAELQRLQSLKSKMLGRLVDEARENILSLWEQINSGPDERRKFIAFHTSDVNDKILDDCNQYIKVLTSRLEQMEPILRAIERREVIVAERMEYEKLQKNPDRLKQRGATRQLMKEEKMAKRIKRDLPRLTDELTVEILAWNEVHEQDFLYNGQSYIDTMEKQEAEWNNYKEEEQQRKLRKKQETSYSGENPNRQIRKAVSTKRVKPMGKKQPLANHN